MGGSESKTNALAACECNDGLEQYIEAANSEVTSSRSARSTSARSARSPVPQDDGFEEFSLAKGHQQLAADDCSTQPGSARLPSRDGIGSSRASSKASACISMNSVAEADYLVALDRYLYSGQKLGEGSSSVCYLGTDMKTGGRVAVKVYKLDDSKPDSRKTSIKKFKRQVSTLLELQQPFWRPADERLWAPELDCTRPSELFVQLLDYSRDETGAAGPGADGSMYVVTELADETLKSFVKRHLESGRPIPVDQVRKVAQEVTLAMAGLHAKGLVHLDMKPENIMMCGGRWKLIDMDSCFRNGAILQGRNGCVSFSPCYCAPEWARFAAEGSSIMVTPALDVWSVGMTIAELVELCPLLRATFQREAKGLSRKEGTLTFLKWLSSQRAPPSLSKECDSSFRELLQGRLLVVDPAQRSTLAESLAADFHCAP